MDRLDVMRLFVRIVERGSFAAAARDLQIPRPTATHAIQRLERDLDVRLLERTTRAVRPTLDGMFYHERCLRLLADLEEVETAFRKAEPRGPLRVDLQGTIARFFIVPQLPAFLARYPGIALSLSEGDRLVDLVAEGVDCVVRAGDPAVPSLVGRRIASLPQATLASPAYLARHGTPQALGDLEGHRMVGYSAAANGRAYPLDFTVEGRVKEVALPHDMLVRGAELYTAACLAGFGLIQVPRYRVREAIAASSLVPVLEDFPPPPVPVWALYPQSRHMAPRLRVFIDWLVDLFQQPAAQALLANHA
ncbi:LysR family transcriptional regulator [Rhizobium sp. YIM 134829]|uniref:LysR family transcriptional regulator n=1 Tax=Rhizobium sp. YIM 134829 TaxID=3390453 RepID=UPI00397BD4D9